MMEPTLTVARSSSSRWMRYLDRKRESWPWNIQQSTKPTSIFANGWRFRITFWHGRILAMLRLLGVVRVAAVLSIG